MVVVGQPENFRGRKPRKLATGKHRRGLRLVAAKLREYEQDSGDFHQSVEKCPHDAFLRISGNCTFTRLCFAAIRSACYCQTKSASPPSRALASLPQVTAPVLCRLGRKDSAERCPLAFSRFQEPLASAYNHIFDPVHRN